MFEIASLYPVLLIVCPLVFLAGFTDSIGGGGGLISLPAYLLAGLPAHQAIATNKLSSTSGTIFSTYRYFKSGYLDLKLATPAIVMALLGAQIGAHFALIVDENIFKLLLMLVLPIVAIYLLFHKNSDSKVKELSLGRRIIIVMIISLLVGAYDGFYGPGTGTFLIILYTNLAKMDILVASGNAKIVNLASNISALSAFLFSGNVIVGLGLIASVFSIAGNLLGSAIAIKEKGRITKPIILIVIILLMLKLTIELL